jgi:hypothetical protein
MSDPIFVFGSNLAGRHGRGAALFAVMNRGAVPGQGVGRQGNSYGIPTKDEALKPLRLEVIAEYVDRFVEYARQHADDTFELTQIGCGLAGYTPEQIAPMFRDVGDNVLMTQTFLKILRGLPI